MATSLWSWCMLQTILTASISHEQRPGARNRQPLALGLALLLPLALACKADSPPAKRAELGTAVPDVATPTIDASLASAPSGTCPLVRRPLRQPGAERIVALGDVHGDLAATKRALRLAGAIDEQDRWVGGKLVLVQTGDILDRGDGEQEILDLFVALESEAKKSGGAIYRLNGNHEFMNAMGDFRYVTTGGFADFETTATTSNPPTSKARAAAFLPGGSYAKRLAALDTVTMVGDTIFVHGGVLPRFVDNLEEMNRQSRCFLLGHSPPPEAIMDPEGPIWTRAFSTGDSSCAELDKTLASLSAKRMVVGHTPQLSGITSACEGKVWRIDTGMADFYQGPTEVLEIKGDDVRMLR